jgi:hypothetical protein
MEKIKETTKKIKTSKTSRNDDLIIKTIQSLNRLKIKS